MATSFKIPSSYSPPEGTKEGVEFSEIATFKYEGDEMMIVNVGQDKVPLDSKEDKKPKGAKQAIKEQLSSLSDKSGTAKMEDTEK